MGHVDQRPLQEVVFDKFGVSVGPGSALPTKKTYYQSKKQSQGTITDQ